MVLHYLSLDLNKKLIYDTNMDIFSALADPTRRSILELLSRSTLSASDIYDKFRVSPQAVSQHLKILRDTNLVKVEKRAQKRLYQINPKTLLMAEEWIHNMTRVWEERFNALDKLLLIEKRKLRKEVK